MTMIDFACKTFNIENIIKCSLGLTKSEYKILGFFIDNPENYFTSEEISKELSLNLTTIQKAVKKLNDKKIINKYQQNLSNGGYIFIYSSNSKSEIKQVIMDTIKNWTKQVEMNMEFW